MTPTMPPTGPSASYDEVPYESNPFPVTHPNRLGAVAQLFGLTPPSVGSCRVLELGCASGGNLIPMAEQFPGSQFVGVDGSGVQIAQGRAVLDQLGLRNVELKHGDILALDDSLGSFDYILCHGVYSWVPEPVQEKILELAHRLLTRNGLAYISYNTYPGWFMRGMIREMMRFHAEKFSTAKVRTQQSRAILDFLAGSVPQDGGPYAALLHQEVEVLRHQADSYLFHEHLEEHNSPLFFRTFVQRAEAHQLRYLAEARVPTMVASNFSPEIEKTLRLLAPDQVQMEQYLDFLRNRMFRETLLCHQDSAVNWAARPEVLYRLQFAARATPQTSTHTMAGDDPAVYRSPGGMTVTTTQPLLKAALASLADAWPQALPFDSLFSTVGERLGRMASSAKEAEDRRILAQALLKVYVTSDLVEFLSTSFPLGTQVKEKPMASPLARWQARDRWVVTNRRHESVRLNAFQFVLVPLLDGNHGRQELVEGLTQAGLNGRITVRKDDQELRDPSVLRAEMDRILDECLQQIATLGLLEA